MAFRFYVGFMFLMTMFVVFMFKEEVPILMTKTYYIKSKEEVVPCHEKGDPKPPTRYDTKKLTNITLDEEQVDIIVAAYVWGYITSIIPGAVVAERTSPSRVMGYSICAAMAFKSLRVLMYDYEWTIVHRFLIGLCLGCVYPAINVLIARWAPPDEKGKFLAATVMGSAGGVIISTYLEPELSCLLGKYSYFINIGLGIIIISVVHSFMTDWPEDQKRVTSFEVKEIKDSHRSQLSDEKRIAPFLKILSCGPFWALCFAEFFNHWSLYLVTIFTPTFKFKTMDVLVLNEQSMYMLPYVGRFFGSFMYGILADLMMKTSEKPITKIRKFFIVFSHFLPAAFFAVVRGAYCFHTVITLFMFLHQLFNSACTVTTLINPQDLAPNFAGTCFGIMHFFGMLSWVVLPMISKVLMEHYGNGLTGAAINYAIGAVLLVTGDVIFTLFGSGELQPWNE